MELESWRTRLHNEVGKLAQQYTNDWIKMLILMGPPESVRNEWCDNYINELNHLFCGLCKQMEQKRAQAISTVEELARMVQNLSATLEVKIPYMENLSLHEEEIMLRNRITDLENKLHERNEKVSVLKQRQIIVCRSLGRNPSEIKEININSEEEIALFTKLIEGMENEIQQRQMEVSQIRKSLKEIAKDMNYVPSSDFETSLLYGDNKDVEVTDVNMHQVNKLYETLKRQMENTRAEICILREKVRTLWTTLGEDLKILATFEQLPYNVETLNALKNELRRCENKKRANLEKFIRRLKEQLEELWKKCGYTEDERAEFIYLNETTYNEDLLSIFQNEVDKVTKFYQENKTLYETLTKYEETGEKFEELERNMRSPNRLKNRGGQLLKEEKERNVMKKRLEKFEENMISMAGKFRKKNLKEFNFNGKTIEMIIAAHYNKRATIKRSNSSQMLQPSNQNLTVPNVKSSIMTKIPAPKSKPGNILNKIVASRKSNLSVDKNNNSTNDKVKKSSVIDNICSTNSV